ncbi:MAG TPA: STAS domain-containing protein [Planctomycetota bacterium]|nr:STAS domain-containing protein [Planctomycetota bacterium]
MPDAPDYEEAIGLLKINKDLGWALDNELREKCRSLIDSKAVNLTIDLSAATHVCSANLVVLAYASALAAKQKKALKIIVSSQVSRAFRAAGLNEVIDIKVV